MLTSPKDAPPPRDAAHCDGQRFRTLFETAAQLLAQRAPRINRLNVFPVPDGDTGTNMLLTLRAALQSIDTPSELSVAAVAGALARGALMGGRGNSGVILSQYLRGFARGVEGYDIVDGRILANALADAARTARNAVGKPTEGTILTVALDAANAAAAAAGESSDVRFVLGRAVEEAKRSVARTPELLPILRQANVVDAGGLGLATILEGCWLALGDEPLPPSDEDPSESPAAIRLVPEDYGFCTEFLIHGQALDVAVIRGKLQALGDSLLVVGEPSLVRVHVHTFTPGQAIDLALAYGSVDHVKIENMQQQNERLRTGSADGLHRATCAMLVVASGAGFHDLYRSLGGVVIPGGQSLNPSTEEIVRAAHLAGSEQFVVLVNNPNVLLAAQQALALTDKVGALIHSRNMAEGVASALAFQAQLPAAENQAAMERARGEVRTAAITRAVRAASLDGRSIEPGAGLGLIDDRIAVTAATVLEAALATLELLEPASSEVITVYYGDGQIESDAGALRQHVLERYPGAQVDVVFGGQPYYPYILACE